MGRQINFLFSNDDQLAFTELIQNKLNALCIMQPILDGEINLVSPVSIARWKSGEQLPFIIREQDLTHLVLDPPLRPGVQNIDWVSSYAVEFSRSISSRRVIRRGRLYYTPSYFNSSNEIQAKSPEFIKFTQGLFRAVKSVCAESRHGWQIGKGALMLEKQGWSLNLNG